jgi:hypothetical protein
MKIPRRASAPPGFARQRAADRSAADTAEPIASQFAPAPTPPAPEALTPPVALAPEANNPHQAQAPPPPASGRPPRPPDAPQARENGLVGDYDRADDAVSIYEGAATRAFNMRILDPLHRRYAALVRRCADEGFETSMTELMHALLHNGPGDAAEAREVVRAWRRVRAGG